jgi:signal peptidase II
VFFSTGGVMEGWKKERLPASFGIREAGIWIGWFGTVIVLGTLYLPFLCVTNFKQVLQHHRMFALFWGILGADYWLKQFFSDLLQLGESINVIPGLFSFTLVHNKGAAFGLFKGFGWLFIALAVVTCIFICIYLMLYREEDRLVSWSLTLILAGALGNMVDRIRYNYVVDYLDVFYRDWHWPVFNLADIVINVGVGLLLLDLLLDMKQSDGEES